MKIFLKNNKTNKIYIYIYIHTNLLENKRKICQDYSNLLENKRKLCQDYSNMFENKRKICQDYSNVHENKRKIAQEDVSYQTVLDIFDIKDIVELSATSCIDAKSYPHLYTPMYCGQ